MVDMLGNDLAVLPPAALPPPETIQLIRGEWRSLPSLCEAVSVAAGDNAFSYMPYPEGWVGLRDHLADRMAPGATLIVRMWSVPASHRPESIASVVARFMARSAINYTEVRTALLYAHRDGETYSIDTEKVLAECLEHYGDFAPLFRRWPLAPGNDFVTIAKYRNAGAVYYAPPLPEIIGVLGERFTISAVHFGPYEMSQYFPLIVGRRTR
jgi:hypothetical protein